MRLSDIMKDQMRLDKYGAIIPIGGILFEIQIVNVSAVSLVNLKFYNLNIFFLLRTAVT